MHTHTHKHLNPSKVRADQKCRKTGSERNEDSIITKAAEFGLPKPLSILPFITTNKPGTSFLITIFIAASAIFNRHAVSLEFKSLWYYRTNPLRFSSSHVSVPGAQWLWSLLTTVTVHLLKTLVFNIWCECRAMFPHWVKSPHLTRTGLKQNSKSVYNL